MRLLKCFCGRWRRTQVTAILIALMSVSVSVQKAEADMFGGDIIVLSQILLNAISQLATLRSIVKNGGDELGIIQDINRGINDSLAMAQTLGIHLDPGLYGKVANVTQAATMIDELFGKVVHSPLARVQRSTDQSVAEAITFNNTLQAYTEQLDQVGDSIKSYSHAVSPGGAAKLTAESLGVVIHVMNQQMRATGYGLKLQAQALAVQNKREKDQTEQYLKEGELLKTQMMAVDASFTVPRF